MPPEAFVDFMNELCARPAEAPPMVILPQSSEMYSDAPLAPPSVIVCEPPNSMPLSAVVAPEMVNEVDVDVDVSSPVAALSDHER